MSTQTAERIAARPNNTLSNEYFAIDRLSHSVGKMVTLLALSLTPDEFTTKYELKDRIIALQGGVPTWEGDDTTIEKYCAATLLPDTIVEKGTKKGMSRESVQAIRLTKRGKSLGLATAGAFLPPAAQGTPVATLLKQQVQPRRIPGTPSRILMYENLLQQPDYTNTADELYNSMRVDKSAGKKAISVLSTHGVITLTDRYDPAYRRFALPEPPPKLQLAPRLRPLAEAAKRLKSNGVTEVDGQTLLDASVSLYPDTKLSPQDIWAKLLKEIQRSSLDQCIQPIPVDRFDPLVHLLAQLRPEYVEPISDLLERRRLVATSPAHRRRYAQTAQELLDQPETIASALQDMYWPRLTSPRPDTTPEGIHENGLQRTKDTALRSAIRAYQTSQGIH
ncbi:MAG TPA: hypothetical protein VLE73_06305 [Candidatus Saccharimonadales bacterium]|nr:hypothetical protein [Candidatus Saccharimonadales bacterium]